MISRVYKMADFGLTEEFAQSFSNEIQRPFNMDHFCEVWDGIIKAGLGAIWKYESEDAMVGTLGAVIAPDMFDGELVATEAVWYVSPAARTGRAAYDLWSEFELWAKASMATRIYAGAAHGNARLLSTLQRRGMKEMETYFTKEII